MLAFCTSLAPGDIRSSVLRNYRYLHHTRLESYCLVFQMLMILVHTKHYPSPGVCFRPVWESDCVGPPVHEQTW